MSFDIPQEYIDAAKGSLSSQNMGVPCPYPAPVLYWRNGDIALASVNEVTSALRFGGWGVDFEKLRVIENLPPQLPARWQLHENLTSKSDGKKYAAYLVRSAHAAPIRRRYRWTTVSEVQYLCYLSDEQFKPWGYCILKASSYDTKALDKCFADFKSMTAEARGTTPENYFYVTIGTFGNEPKFTTRDSKQKPGTSSQVTPPQLFVPQSGMTPENVKQCFVGKDAAADIYLALNDPRVKEWVEDWEKPKQQQAQVAHSDSYDDTPDFMRE